jgi:hypothetical protein
MIYDVLYKACVLIMLNKISGIFIVLYFIKVSNTLPQSMDKISWYGQLRVYVESLRAYPKSRRDPNIDASSQDFWDRFLDKIIEKN